MKYYLAPTLLFWVFSTAIGQEIMPPQQPLTGPGGREYVCDSVTFYDMKSRRQDGYWLFEPRSPMPDSAHVIVFSHGYGSYNPMIYGQWIRHLVRHGNIVIFPRYQKNLYYPKAKHFAENDAKAIKKALEVLRTQPNHTRPITTQFTLVGHSYGGTVSALLAAEYQRFGIPKPMAVMLVQPGTSKLKGGRLADYSNIPTDTKLFIITSQEDWVVGDELGEIVFRTATKTPQRAWVKLYRDFHGSVDLHALHAEPYSMDYAFDSGMRNYTAKRAIRRNRLNTIDYYAFWMRLDALLDCTRINQNCNICFGNTPTQSDMSVWSDGIPVRPLKIQEERLNDE